MKFSKIGLSLIGIYLSITLSLWIYAATCKTLYCGLIVLVSIFPWFFVFENFMDDSIFSYLLSIGLNLIFVYTVGIGLSKLWGRIHGKGS